MIRIHIVEDNETIVVSGLRSLFRPGRDSILIQGSSDSVEKMIQTVHADEIDMIILDLYIRNTNPKENIRMLKQHYPETPVMILTNETSGSWISAMRKEGASAYLMKDTGREELKLAIQKTASGKFYFPELPDVSELKNQTDEEQKFQSLPVDQQNIIRLLAQGLYHDEIAQHLNQSRSSVEKKLSEIRTVFQVRTNIELIHLLTRSGQV